MNRKHRYDMRQNSLGVGLEKEGSSVSGENRDAVLKKGNDAAEAAGQKKTGRRKKKRKWLKRLIITAVILAVLGVWGWNTISGLQAEYTVTYDPFTATTGNISNSLSFSGTMQLIDSASYTASSDTKVREVYVTTGQKVKDGDRLIRLSDGTTLKAEFDGTVSAVEAEKGDEVRSGANLVTLADFDHMRVSVRVGESDIADVYAGQTCRVAVSSAGATFDSTISKIDYVSYTGNNVAYYTTTVDVNTGAVKNIYPGMQATVTVPLEEANNVTVLKMEALSTARDNTAFVYKESADGTMAVCPVTVGVSNGNYVEIKSGVESGETVYAVAKQEEQLTGLAGLFSSMFSRQQVNRPGNTNSGGRNWNREGNGPNGSYSGGGNGGIPSGTGGGTSTGGAPSGGGRGN